MVLVVSLCCNLGPWVVIFFQGNQVFKDFDIKRAAGGASFSPVTREVTAEVLNNYLEVHFFWAGKGFSYIRDQGDLGPLISAISATPRIWTPIGVVSLLTLLALYIIRQQRKRRDTSGNYDEHEEFLGIDTRPYTFGYGDLRDATDDFSPANKLGEGGFGPVYKSPFLLLINKVNHNWLDGME
uniref:non-specific serine/threonine protein kinase n=1 Tax=Lactuca sativa TaxID=4236 RepID=A0A9R1V134_LACSA|nr:hypothetical protein LSAT_V11C700386030 [Lactuca sativa]